MRISVLVAVLVLIPVSYADAQILPVERDALIALYNSTDGANRSDNTGWLGAVGTECTWYGVTCSGGRVQKLLLFWNNLSGSIPPELGDLSNLQRLTLYGNQLRGSIPPELGNLPSLLYLNLHSNQLSGDIPAELENLSTLTFWGGLTLMYNALHTDSASLIEFINSRHWYGYDWQGTQTIAPENLTVASVGDHTVWLSWDAVSYQSDPGGYEVFSTPTGSGNEL